MVGGKVPERTVSGYRELEESESCRAEPCRFTLDPERAVGRHRLRGSESCSKRPCGTTLTWFSPPPPILGRFLRKAVLTRQPAAAMGPGTAGEAALYSRKSSSLGMETTTAFPL